MPESENPEYPQPPRRGPRDRTRPSAKSLSELSRPFDLQTGVQSRLDEKARQRERAANWIRDHWTVPAACALCGSNNWQIGDVFSLSEHWTRPPTVAESLMRAETLPVFPVTCNVCGNTVFINALVSDVVDPGDQAAGT
jgi:5-methylcytosine-specific restriction endonuclease McrA